MDHSPVIFDLLIWVTANVGRIIAALELKARSEYHAKKVGLSTGAILGSDEV